MSTSEAKFDGLANNYDQARPRYPAELFRHVVEYLPKTDRLTVVDAGAGTGIALEGLLPHLPDDAAVHAVDVSTDMIRVGREKFPHVVWHEGTAEGYLASCPSSSVDLVVAAQSYQWMDRAAYVREAARCLGPAGLCLVIQNNRNHAAAVSPPRTRTCWRNSRPATAARTAASTSRTNWAWCSRRWSAGHPSGCRR
ncbi:class I SAM-dependent methyltransferase [Streptomyces nogalater]